MSFGLLLNVNNRPLKVQEDCKPPELALCSMIQNKYFCSRCCQCERQKICKAYSENQSNLEDADVRKIFTCNLR